MINILALFLTGTRVATADAVAARAPGAQQGWFQAGPQAHASGPLTLKGLSAHEHMSSNLRCL